MNIAMMLKNEEKSLPDCCCEDMQKAISDDEHPMYYSSAYEEYGIQLSSKFEYSILNYCAWCGAKLPESRRDVWFEELEEIKVDPWENEIPVKYLSSSWWSNA